MTDPKITLQKQLMIKLLNEHILIIPRDNEFDANNYASQDLWLVSG